MARVHLTPSTGEDLSAAPPSARRSEDHHGLLARLGRDIRETLSPLTPAGQFALVDFPANSNVGDSAIWLGQLKMMREVFGAEPAYVCKLDNFDPVACRAAIGAGPIFIQGGGNFGDLWPAHHEFRLRLLAGCPDHPIIQLPQSIHFRNAAGIETTARAIAAHRNFTLLVRDRASLELARRSFDCETRLCCDLAIYLGAQPRACRPRADVFCLLRTDAERAIRGEPGIHSTEVIVADWLHESRVRVRCHRLLAIIGAAVTGHASRQRFVSYQTAAHERFHRGLRLLSTGRVVVTDRLHAHILSVLLGLPHAVLDNSYGKVSGFIGAWTESYSPMQQETSLVAAIDWATREASTRAWRAS